MQLNSYPVIKKIEVGGSTYALGNESYVASTAEWASSTYVPANGEIIVYRDGNENRLKVGDGVNLAADLSFTDAESIDPALLVGQKTEAGGEIFNLYEDTETDIGSIAGISFGKQTLPKNAALGEYSHAQGISTTAAGRGSHAQGVGVFVSGSSAHGEGLGANFMVTAKSIEGDVVTIESNQSSTLVKASELESIEKNAVIWYETNANTHEGKFYYVVKVELVKNFLQITTSSKLTLNETPTFAAGTQLKVLLGAALASMSHVEGGFSATLDPESTKLYGVDATTKKLQHAEGAHNLAIGFASHVEGQYSVALGSHSHAQGLSTSAEGIAASTSGQNTKATGDCSHAGGRGAVAQGGDSLAYGYNTQANGYASVAVGSGSKAIGEYSFAGGQSSEANNNHSFAFGLAVRTNADTQGQFAVGKFNSSVQDAMFVVGNGESDGDKSNAFVVMSDGSATIKNMGTEDNSVATKSYVDSKNHLIVGPGGAYGTATGDYSVAIMGEALANGATAIGYGSKAEGLSSFAGPDATARGTHSVAFGTSEAQGFGDFAAGSGNTAKGGDSVALGNSTVASGYGSMTMGKSSQALGSYSFAGGRSAWAGSDYSFAYGLDTYTDENTPAQFTVGKYNARAQDALFVVGNGESASARSNAFIVMQDGSATIKTMGTSDNSVATKKYVDEHSAADKMDKFGTYTTEYHDGKYGGWYNGYLTIDEDVEQFYIRSTPSVSIEGINGVNIAAGSEDGTSVSGLYIFDTEAQLISTKNVIIRGQEGTIIKNIGTPTEDNDAVNKKYVDDSIASIPGGGSDCKFNDLGTLSSFGDNGVIDWNDFQLKAKSTTFNAPEAITLQNSSLSSIGVWQGGVAIYGEDNGYGQGGTVQIHARKGVYIHNIVDPVEDGDAISKKYVKENYVSREEYNALLDSIIALQEQLLAKGE